MTELLVEIRAEGRVSERRIDLARGLTYEDLFDRLKINPETAVALFEGHPVPNDELVMPGGVEIVRIVSAG
ncbi:MAG: thiamine biosynthesis protein ThiS [Methanothrix sp.]|nr:thiamine biosynthesis protein ThiS [Methanothrix sp.]MDI9399249.1 thiamine biosynthesis protein ThiS [Euryarchaeota archaeon]